MQKYQRPIVVVILCLVFTTLFLYQTKSDFPLIFKKDLLAHDESVNSVVAANVTRKFFPPMVRINPLNEEVGNWMEGPYWQHIPPMFAYVPYLFFQLDGQVTIEVKRLAFAFLTWLTGIFFILGITWFKKSLWAALAATLAVIFWVQRPFTHELITGYAFGVSDIVLAFTVVLSFLVIIWYLKGDREQRRNYPYWKIAVIAMIVVTPLLAKNLLGAIPIATFYLFLLRDHRRINRKVITAAVSSLGLLLVYWLPFYFSSPQTFKQEVFVAFLHFKRLEGWERPWYWYLTDYFPKRYLFGWTLPFYIGIILGLIYKPQNREDRILLIVSSGWFLWNLIAVSLVTSKVPNFIYQSFLLSIFFVIYSFISFAIPRSQDLKDHFQKIPWPRQTLGIVLAVSVMVTGYEILRFGQEFRNQRAMAYSYESEHEKFYQTAQYLLDLGADTQDLVVVNDPPNDCWFRYYVLFLTGAESKTLLELYLHTVPYASIQQKYRQIYLVDQNLNTRKINSEELSQTLNSTSFDAEIERIKKDKTACQWLVPDEILNAQ